MSDSKAFLKKGSQTFVTTYVSVKTVSLLEHLEIGIAIQNVFPPT